MRSRGKACEEGGALLISTVFMAVIIMVTGTLVAITLSSSRSHVDRMVLEETRRVADGALAIAIGKMANASPVPAQMSGTITSNTTQTSFVKGIKWAVRVSQSSGDSSYYKVSVAAGSSSAYTLRQAFIQVPSSIPPVPPGVGGAISSDNASWIQSSSITVQGKPDTKFGNASLTSGSNAVQNGGVFTPKGTVNGPVQDNATIGTGTGQIPNTPGRAIGVSDDYLKSNVNPLPSVNAPGVPLYFTNSAALTAWVNGNKDANGYIPNTHTYYWNFDGTDPTSLPMDPSKAYVVINHNPGGGSEPTDPTQPSAGMCNCGMIDNDFHGILIIDGFDKLHTTITGTFIVLGDYSHGMMKINGSGNVYFSAGAIGYALQGSLSSTSTSTTPKVVAYIENPAMDNDVAGAIQDCGFTAGASATTDLNAYPTTPYAYRRPQ